MVSSGRAFVTGASAGIGAAFAERLAAAGNDLILVARRRDRLEALAERLGRETSASIEVLAADLADSEGLARAEERAGRGDVSLLVNNAGFGGYRPFVEMDPAVAEELVRVHVLATVRLSRAALPGMVSRGAGGIINVSSLLAFSGALPPKPLPHRATYAGAKAFVVTFTEALAGELAGTGVNVVVCCPGIVATEFHEVMDLDLSSLPRMSSDEVVQAALVALDRGEVMCVPPLEDATLVDKLVEAQQALLGAGGPKLSSRYRG
jgi:uncharacterized protein